MLEVYTMQQGRCSYLIERFNSSHPHLFKGEELLCLRYNGNKNSNAGMKECLTGGLISQREIRGMKPIERSA